MNAYETTHAETGKSCICRDFPDADSFWRQVAAEPAYQGHRSSRTTDNNTWSGTPSFEAAMELATQGWPEGTEQCKKLAQSLTATVGSMTRVPEVVFDVTGDCLDMGAVMEGSPEHWMSDQESEEEVRDQSHGRLIRISINLFASCGVSSENMQRRAAAITACVNLIEQSNRCAEVIGILAVQPSGGGSKHWALSFPIKRADEPMQIDRLAFANGHTSMFRRILFSLGETLPEGKDFGYCAHGGYGYPDTLSSDHHLRGDLHFDRMSSRDDQRPFSSDELALESVTKHMRDLGVIEAD